MYSFTDLGAGGVVVLWRPCFVWNRFLIQTLDLLNRSYDELVHSKVNILVVTTQKFDETSQKYHDDVIKWNYFLRYWPFVRGIHRSTVNSPHKGQWSGALMFSLVCARMNGWVNNREAGDFRRHGAHFDVIVIWSLVLRLRQGLV